MNLTTSLESIKGVGPKTAEQLAAAGLVTVGDLVTFLPRKHEDFSQIVAIADIVPGKQTIRAQVESIEVRHVRRGMTVTTATLVDGSGKLRAVWFNQPYRKTQFVLIADKPLDNSDKGASVSQKSRSKDDSLHNKAVEYYFSGTFEFKGGRYQLTNPSAERVSDMPVQTDRILPIYRAIRGLKSQVVRKILAELRPLITMLPETLPPDIVASQRLVSYADALLGLHFPTSAEDIERARERLGFEELFQLLLASQLNRQDNAKLRGEPIPFDLAKVKSFVAGLPFQLTNAQRIAAWEIIQDFERPIPMNRLLQGDVGSGKTVVAGIAALEAAQAGFQTALMAPTEILARQHAETLERLLTPFGITVGLAIGSVKGKSRQALYEQISSGAVAVIVGTHALIEDAVQFHRLGFVIIDEQHRFGVMQRQKLLAKVSRERREDEVGSKEYGRTANAEWRATTVAPPIQPSLSEDSALPAEHDQDKLVGGGHVHLNGVMGVVGVNEETGRSTTAPLEDSAFPAVVRQEAPAIHQLAPNRSERRGGRVSGAESATMPHLLAMTATPIPRSLQLTVFGELDVSVLDELPAGRKPIKSKIISPNSAKATYEIIAQELAAGRQAYAITPLIEDSRVSDKTSVEAELRKLRNSPLGGYRIGTLHGRMKPDEKDAVMREFKDHTIDLLISTTVVEVGVDVPNASVIMIEDADHFGLAQLHQLRGRVGRGEHQSYCYLMMSDNSKPSERLREIERSNDGFYLAEVDLRLRGPGEVYGRAQHGELNLQIASLADTRQIKRAQLAAEQFVTSGHSLLQYKQLATAVQHYQRLTTLN